MSAEVDMATAESSGRAENSVRRRGGLPKPRPISATTSLRSSGSPIPHVYPDAIVDHEEEHSSSDEAASRRLSRVTAPGIAVSGAAAAADLDGSPPSHHAPFGEESGGGGGRVPGTSRDRRGPRSRRMPRSSAHQRPNSLALSETESSPFVAQDSGGGLLKARRRVTQASSPSTSSSSAAAAAAAAAGNALGQSFSERQASGPDLSWSPEYPEYAIAASQPPPPLPQFAPSFDPRFAGPQQYPQQPYPGPQYEYGVPETSTPRGTAAPFSYFHAPAPPPAALPPPSSAPPQPPVPMAAAPPAAAAGPPVPGNVGLHGYGLLAAKIAGDMGGPPVKPIYRRFDTANHRILLTLQDEILSLKIQIDHLDAIDADERQGAPASEREERDSRTQHHHIKGRYLNSLASKLQQYYTLLASFNSMREMSQPTADDIRAYRRFLDAQRPVVDEELEFLDEHDLVVMDNRRTRDGADAATAEPGAPLTRAQLQELVVGMLIATFGPLITFPVVRDIAGRLMIVLLTSVVVYIVALRSGLNAVITAQEARGLLVWTAAYVGGMAILSWLL